MVYSTYVKPSLTASERIEQELRQANANSAQKQLDSAISEARGQGSAAIDTARNYGTQAISTSQQAVDNARDYANRSIASGQSGVSAILSGRGAVDDARAALRKIGNAANAEYDDAAKTARGMESDILAIRRGAADVRGVAEALTPYADALRQYGAEMWNDAGTVMDDALSTLGVGMGFINMDASAAPLVAEALRLYGEFDPDKYVAEAAQDVQSAYANARGQQERALSRMGVNPSSGAYQNAMQKLYSQSLATALSAAMTKAKERGKTEQSSQFQKLIVDNALKFLQDGGSLANTASGMQSSAANVYGSGAGILEKQAGLYADAASVYKNSGALQGSLAELLSGIAGNRASTLAGLETTASNLATNYAKEVQSAYSTLANIQQNAGNSVTGALNSLASMTQGVGNSIASAQQKHADVLNSTEALRVHAVNGGRSGGGTTTTGGVASSADDWMNWKGTGHSETWNRNNNPNYQTLLDSGR